MIPIESAVVSSRETNNSGALGYLFDAFPVGVMLLGRDRQVLIMNERARDAVAREVGVRVDAIGRVSAVDSRETRLLEDAVEATVRSAEAGLDVCRFVALRRADQGCPLLLQFRPISTSAGGFACVFLFDADRVPVPTDETLKIVFGMTPAEAELSVALARGLTLDEYRADRGVSRNTVKTQLSRAMEKTGTCRQTALLRLLYLLGLSPHPKRVAPSARGARCSGVWGA